MPVVDSAQARPVSRLVGELHEIETAEGRIWRVHTQSEGFADHVWQQRERLLQLSNGAKAVVVCWTDEDGEPVEVSYSPELPSTLAA